MEKVILMLLNEGAKNGLKYRADIQRSAHLHFYFFNLMRNSTTVRVQSCSILNDKEKDLNSHNS